MSVKHNLSLLFLDNFITYEAGMYKNFLNLNSFRERLTFPLQLTPSEIYEQVSYLRSSVEEVNRMISEQELPSSKPNDNTKKHEECSVNKRKNIFYNKKKSILFFNSLNYFKQF